MKRRPDSGDRRPQEKRSGERGSRSGLRIIAGAWRGRRLRSSPGTRPSQERLREALLSRWHPAMVGATVLELFAGSGVIALETLSRGAEAAYLIDREIETGVANAELLDARNAYILRAELPKALACLPTAWPQQYDLVFADPPYDWSDPQRLLREMAPHLSIAGELALEHGSPELPERVDVSDRTLSRVDLRHYGGSWLAFYRWPEEAEPGGDS